MLTDLADVVTALRRSNDGFLTCHAEVRRRWSESGVAEATARWGATQPPGSVDAVGLGPSRYAIADAHELARIWLLKPSRYRLELHSAAFSRPLIHLFTPEGEWAVNPWSGSTMQRLSTGEESQNILAGAAMREVWDPAHLVPLLIFDQASHATFRARDAIQVLARPRQHADETASIPWPGSDEYELIVDTERGVLLRLGARVAGQEFASQEVEWVTFDEPVADALFRPDGEPGSR